DNGFAGSGAGGTGPTQQRAAVDLPAGQTRSYSLYTVAASNVNVALVDGAGNAVVQSGVTLSADQGPIVAVVSDDPSPLDALAAVRLPGSNDPPRLAHLSPADLPDNPV